MFSVRTMDALTLSQQREAALIAQTQHAQRDVFILRQNVEQLTRELHALRLAHSHVSKRLAVRDGRLKVIRDRAALACARLCDPFARMILQDIAIRADDELELDRAA